MGKKSGKQQRETMCTRLRFTSVSIVYFEQVNVGWVGFKSQNKQFITEACSESCPTTKAELSTKIVISFDKLTL